MSEAIVKCLLPESEVTPDCRQNITWMCGECPYSELFVVRSDLQIKIEPKNEVGTKN